MEPRRLHPPGIVRRSGADGEFVPAGMTRRPPIAGDGHEGPPVQFRGMDQPTPRYQPEAVAVFEETGVDDLDLARRVRLEGAGHRCADVAPPRSVPTRRADAGAGFVEPVRDAVDQRSVRHEARRPEGSVVAGQFFADPCGLAAEQAQMRLPWRRVIRVAPALQPAAVPMRIFLAGDDHDLPAAQYNDRRGIVQMPIVRCNA